MQYKTGQKLAACLRNFLVKERIKDSWKGKWGSKRMFRIHALNHYNTLFHLVRLKTGY